MAKAMNVMEALAVLAGDTEGFKFTAEQKKMIQAMTKNTFSDSAVAILVGNGDNLPGKLNEEVRNADVASTWVESLFSLAENMTNDIEGAFKTVQGGGLRKVHVLGFDTPHGHIKVELRSAE